MCVYGIVHHPAGPGGRLAGRYAYATCIPAPALTSMAEDAPRRPARILLQRTTYTDTIYNDYVG